MKADAARSFAEIPGHCYTLPKAAPVGYSTLDASPASASVLGRAKDKLAKFQLHQLAGNLKTATIRHADQIRYRTKPQYFVADLRDVKSASQALYEKTLSKVGAHLHREFHDCDSDYASAKSATAAVAKRLASEHPYETTYVTYRLKTDRLTGKTSPGLVSTIGLRQFDNPPFPTHGEGWAGDFVTAAKFRGLGHGKRLGAVAAAEAHNHPSLGGKLRLYAEDHNVAMYERHGGEVAAIETIKDDKDEDLQVTIMTMDTSTAEAELGKLDVQGATLTLTRS